MAAVYDNLFVLLCLCLIYFFKIRFLPLKRTHFFEVLNFSNTSTIACRDSQTSVSASADGNSNSGTSPIASPENSPHKLRKSSRGGKYDFCFLLLLLLQYYIILFAIILFCCFLLVLLFLLLRHLRTHRISFADQLIFYII